MNAKDNAWLQHAVQQLMQVCTTDSSHPSQDVNITAHEIFLIRARWFGICPVFEFAKK